MARRKSVELMLGILTDQPSRAADILSGFERDDPFRYAKYAGNLEARYDAVVGVASEAVTQLAALKQALKYHHEYGTDEVDCAADVYESCLRAGQPMPEREIHPQEIKMGRIIGDDERCSKCDEPLDKDEEGMCEVCVEFAKSNAKR